MDTDDYIIHNLLKINEAMDINCCISVNKWFRPTSIIT